MANLLRVLGTGPIVRLQNLWCEAEEDDRVAERGNGLVHGKLVREAYAGHKKPPMKV